KLHEEFLRVASEADRLKSSATLPRVLTAAVLIPAVVAAVWWGPTGLIAALTGLVTLLALLEFFALGARAGLYGYRIWTCVCALALLLGQWSATEAESWSVGRSAGRMLMSPQLSPKKTWEGAAANLVGSLGVALVFARWMSIEPRHLVVMAALGNISGQVGDLLESAYKRSAGVKDSGGLLP